jgi:hypothetical protein
MTQGNTRQQIETCSRIVSGHSDGSARDDQDIDALKLRIKEKRENLLDFNPCITAASS